MSNFMKICPVGAELFFADRQTEPDMMKLSHFFAVLQMCQKIKGSSAVFGPL